MYSNKKILVTGGCGFLGSNLCQKLLNLNAKVICLDDLSTGRMKNIEKFKNNPNFEFVHQDITIKKNYKVEYIFNLACPASPVKYQKDAIKTTLTSFLGAYNMLELAKENKAKILQASTSEVYGNPLEHPQKESYFGNVNPNGIRSCYDEGKRCAETLFCDFHRQYQVDTKIVRIFNTYGVNMEANDGRVVSNFINQALRNEDITIYGEGDQTRSFCYVDDLIEGLILLMNSKYHYPINIGNPEEYNILETAQLIIKLTNSNSKITFKPIPQDDPIKRKPDITLAKNLLNWQPKVDFKSGLEKTIKYFKNELNEVKS